ncbi:EED [Cordylochernes scorpioides]|uniref:EED n=1 Tax=Cordylochernes scorpioides TaxID=51811 RepID=A0ABY6KU03_9ARAC|nr:EED [Cordylochernes scorpioides]
MLITKPRCLGRSPADETSSVGSASTNDNNNSRSDTPTGRGRKRTRGKHSKYRHCKLAYKCSGSLKENHNQPLFGVQFNTYLKDGRDIFATVGSNKITIYECLEGGGIKPIQSYTDPDVSFQLVCEITKYFSITWRQSEENFYTCAWSYESTKGYPLLAAAGTRGVIRIINCAIHKCIKHYIGHGNAINELKFHPQNNNLLLSVSKDHALRLWNIKTEQCIVIFGGVEGHRDEVLSADFDLLGTKIISCGMDHSLKIWQLDSDKIQNAIKSSYNPKTNNKILILVGHQVWLLQAIPYSEATFPQVHYKRHSPELCGLCPMVGTVGSLQGQSPHPLGHLTPSSDSLLLQSCENCIVCWKPGQPDQQELPPDSSVTVLFRLDFKECDIWFMRFSLDVEQKVLALGNQAGKVYVWDLDLDDPTGHRCTILTHPKCTSAIRQTSLNRDGSILLCVCDDSSVWRWDCVSTAAVSSSN